MVRFKPPRLITLASTSMMFQFHDGSIQASTDFQLTGWAIRCFNSTMVRFKLRKQYPEVIANFEVSIPRWFDSSQDSPQAPPLLCLSFNSTMVRFKQSFRERHGWSFSRFNSTMVRFKLIPDSRFQVATIVSIPRWFDSSRLTGMLLRIVSASFNSTMVRFKHNLAKDNPRLREACFNSTMVRFKPCDVFQVRA